MAVDNYNVAFTPDQARDMLEIRHMAVTHTPKLIGPITDIIGLYLGPFWYYLNLIPFVISQGNPLSLVYFSIIIFHLFSIFIFIIISKKDKPLGTLSSSLLLLSPVAFLTTRFSFNANAVFYFSALFPVFLFFKSKKAALFEGILCGIILQLQAAIGILFFPIAVILYCRKDKQNRHLLPLILGFLLTLVPQIAFELNHHFLMTNALLNEFFGNSSFLGEKFSFIQIVLNRLDRFLSIFSGTTYISVVAVFSIIFLGLIISQKKSVSRQFLNTNLILIGVFFVFFLFFPYNLKDWYLYGLVPFTVYSFASALNIIWKKLSIRFISIIVFLWIIFASFSANFNYLQTIANNPSNDPSNLQNMMNTIDTVYTIAGHQSFIVYNYLPSVYDYGYQYLFWWYGTKKYGYQPAEIAYLPNVPEYIKNNQVYWTKKKTDPHITFLIIQHDQAAPKREYDWRGKFPESKEIKNLPWNTTIEKLDTLVN